MDSFVSLTSSSRKIPDFAFTLLNKVAEDITIKHV